MAAAKPSKASNGTKALDRFLSEARTIPRVTPLRADPVLAQQNVARGVEAVMRHEIEIRRSLPKVDVGELRSLPDLARAVAHAASEAERAAPKKERAAASKNELRALLSRARALREVMLASADSLAAAGLVSPAEVDKIRSGLGPLDSARDCTVLAALFRKHAAVVKGKSPVAKATIDEADALGAELLQRLKPPPSTREKTPLENAVAARDRLWSLLLQRHGTLWRVGAYLFGREVDRKVPQLQAASGTKKAAVALKA